MNFVTKFAARAAVLAVVGCAAIVPGWAQTVLTVQASVAPGNSLYGGMALFAERVDKLSGGRLKLNILPAGAVVPVFETLDATSTGVLDGAFASPSYWFGRNQAAALFGNAPGGPFGMDAEDYMNWMLNGEGLELYRQFYTDVLQRDVMAFPLMSLNPAMLGWFKGEVTSWDSLKGMKCRQVGVGGTVFAAAGMPVVNLPGGEILPAGERGVIDCAEWIGPGEDLAMGFHQVWKNYYMPSVLDPIAQNEVLINGNVYRGLAPDLQEILMSAAIETTFRYLGVFNKNNAEALKVLTDEHGVQIRKTPDDVQQHMLQAWDEIVKKAEAENEFFRKVAESQRAFASTVVPARLNMYPPYSYSATYYWPDATK